MLTPTIALLGNPNSGKTTLFNALTGRKKAVGNWSGVTVTEQMGCGAIDNQAFQVIDLPGTYSLTVIEDDSIHDESVPAAFLKTGDFSFVLNVVDAVTLERQLYLTLQALEQQIPLVLLINRIDLLEKQGKNLSCDRLSSLLGCRVEAINTQDRSKPWLKALLDNPTVLAVKPLRLSYPEIIEAQLKSIPHPRWQVLRWLEGEKPTLPHLISEIHQAQIAIETALGEPADVSIAKTRYAFIEQYLQDVTVTEGSAQSASQHPLPSQQTSFSDKLDAILCHRVWGLPCFFAAMYALFFFAIGVGGAFQEIFESGASFLFVDCVTKGLTALSAPGWLHALLVNGLGLGLTTIVTFIPVIGAMFLALSFLEESGYMARAAFVMDRLMRAVGLPGKSFVPMIIGFGCNVPAILGTRTLDNRRDRILAVMMSPFMSCGARLAIFTVFVAAFFPRGGQNIVFLLYIIGIAMAVLTGLFLKKTLLRGNNAPFILEMPRFQWPQLRLLRRMSWHRLKRFILNAGKLILPVCMVIGLCDQQGSPDSVLAWIGQAIVPVFEPMGITPDNWPAAVGLLTGLMAKEVVIGTLNALYATPGDLVTHFQAQANAFAYLLFVLLYFPCMSATAAMLREVQKGWTLFSVCWTTGLAYAVAVGFYQCATFKDHPLQSLIWLGVITAAAAATWYGIRGYSRAHLWQKVPTRVVLT